MSGFWYVTVIATILGALLSATPFYRVMGDWAADTAISIKPNGSQTAPAETASSDLEAETGAEADNKTAANTTERNYQRATELADQAVEAYQSARDTDSEARSLAFTRQERFLWQATLAKLATIPKSSKHYKDAGIKQRHYQRLLATAESKLIEIDSAFLSEIIRDVGVSPQTVHVTLCQIDLPADLPADETSAQTDLVAPAALISNGKVSGTHCRHHLGEERLASAASLIKLPIAIALMHKVATEEIDLDSKLYVDPGNFTETAAGSQITVDKEYPLGKVMTYMINESNNIATNQLIDYLGRDYITQTLDEMGYVDTYAGRKLVGDSAIPADMGDRINQATTNEIAAMMASVYTSQTPIDKELRFALLDQLDYEFGYDALKKMGPAVHWMGEKTGQNDRVIGSVLAMTIGEESYVLSVALDHSGEAGALRQIIRDTASHVLETGPLIDRPER
ncbi:MAG: serine hydrolase [Phormidesmis sp.]